MRYVPALLTLVILLTGCNMVGVSVGTRSGSGGVSVNTGTGGTGVRVSTGAGIAVGVNSSGDFLYSGNGEAYATNKRGLREMLDKQYETARSTFEANLEKYPGNPDATYYLGLTLIYLGEREAGFARLLQYRDTFKIRITQEVKWWAEYCRKKPELTPEDIHRVLNKARNEGYIKDQEEYWGDRRW